VKLLFDQNLSPRLVERLADRYPGSAHVQPIGLDRGSDDAVWIHARANGMTIVTKDDDFNDLAVFRGFPPKVIWLQLGNCTTLQVEAAFRARHGEIEAFNADPDAGTFVLR
jgi:predicted nuclease of predicted toxin-antitoxin system